MGDYEAFIYGIGRLNHPVAETHAKVNSRITHYAKNSISQRNILMTQEAQVAYREFNPG